MNTIRNIILAEARHAEIVQQADIALLEHLNVMGQEISAQRDTSAMFQTLSRRLHEMIDADSFSVYLLDPDGLFLTLAFGVETGESIAPHSIPMSEETVLPVRCARERRKLATGTSDAGHFASLSGLRQVASVLFVPMAAGDKLLGVMGVQSAQPHAFSEREQMIFHLLCTYSTIAIDKAMTHSRLNEALMMLRETVNEKFELERACQKLKEVSLTDSLTGLRNRRFLREHLNGDINACLRRYDKCLDDPSRPLPDETDLIFFMVDIDHFKEINDTHGHAAGDVVLVQMAQRLQEVSRTSDYLVRWGGEEFLIVARSINRAAAGQIAERVRAAVADRDFILNDGLRVSVTCSVGFACFPLVPASPRMLSWTETVELADQALYKAKLAGRNTCRGACDPSDEHAPCFTDQSLQLAAPSSETINFCI